MTTIDNIQNTILPRPFWGVDKGGNFIGFLSFIVINCVIFIVIADKSKCYKNETYICDAHTLVSCLMQKIFNSELATADKGIR